MRARGTPTRVRRANDGDVDMLVAWHADPDVSRYWDDETFTREQMQERLARPDVEPFVVESGGEPIGYLQAWRGERGGGGIDMFLLPHARGRGLGPDVARAFARSLLAEGWTEVTVDPYVWNERAVRAWRKAGFEPVAEERPADDEHTAPWLLMRFAG